MAPQFPASWLLCLTYLQLVLPCPEKPSSRETLETSTKVLDSGLKDLGQFLKVKSTSESLGLY